MISQQLLKSILDYNPDTGIFTWKNRKYKNSRRDFTAGSKDSQTGYIKICVNNTITQAHKLAFVYMVDRWPNFPLEEVDHINGIRDDNRWANLRIAEKSENQRNSSKRKDNKSGVTGVNWHKETGKWTAQIQLNKKKIYLGVYDDRFEAICARKAANIKYGFHKGHGKTLPSKS